MSLKLKTLLEKERAEIMDVKNNDGLNYLFKLRYQTHKDYLKVITVEDFELLSEDGEEYELHSEINNINSRYRPGTELVKGPLENDILNRMKDIGAVFRRVGVIFSNLVDIASHPQGFGIIPIYITCDEFLEEVLHMKGECK